MRVVACFGWKYEPEWLVEELKENLKWVDAFAIVDCRHRTDEFWIHEGEYRKLQRRECARAKADWVLVTSPDERFEKNAEEVIREATETRRRRIFRFPLKEMFTPTAYRTDGLWGRKHRKRLYPFLPGQRMTDRKIQSSPVPIERGYSRRTLDVNIYHLKQIEPESRVNRALAYERLDPDYKYMVKGKPMLQKLDPEGLFDEHGYHYLHNTDGMVLEEIPEGREFAPAYTRPYVFRPAELAATC